MTESQQHTAQAPYQQQNETPSDQPEEPSGPRRQPAGRPRPALGRRARDAVRRLNLYGTQQVPRRMHRGMIGLWYYGLSLSAANAFFGSYITLYLLALGASRAQVGWLASIANFLGFLAPIPGAMLSRRWGKPRAIVAIFTVLRRVPLLLAALAPLWFSGETLILVLIGLFALRLCFLSIYNPAFVSLMGAVIPAHVRGRYLGARKMVMALASALLVPLAGWLIDRIGEPLGYQVTLGIGFAVGLSGAYSIAMIPDHQVQASVRAERAGGSFWQAITGNRVFALYLVIRLIFNFVWQLGGPYFRVYQKEVLMSSTQLIGALVTVTEITRLIGQRFWGGVVDRKGAGWVLTVCTLVIPLMPFVWVFATEPWHIVFVSLPSGFLWAGFNMGALNLLLDLPEPRHRTQAAAAHMMAIRVGNILGPLVGNLVIRGLGYRWDFALSGIGRLVAGLMLMALLKPFAERSVPQEMRAQRLSATG